MVEEFTLPDVGEGVAEGELVSWLVEPGDAVSEDQPVAEVETDKALVEVPSPFDGSVHDLHAEEGEMVPVGDVIISFDVEGEARGASERASGEAASDADPTAEEEPAEPTQDAGGAVDSSAESGVASGEAPTPKGRVFAPPRVRKLAREQGVDIATVEGSGPGGRITEDDVEVTATDAAAEPEATGTETAPETDDGTEPASPSPSSADAGSVESADRERTLATPATRRVAEEQGVDLNTVPATEERDGEAFVTPEAVREYAEAQTRAQEADAAAVATGETGPRERREAFRGVRKTIADAMVESKYTAPHVTHHDEVDVTRLVEIRERLKPHAEEQGINLTYMPFIMKAAVAALKEFPEMNAMIDDENEEVVYRNYYNVGIAAATDAGLMVPVVEEADHKGMLQLSSEMNELVTKARERTISPDELRGSTFTITNIGGIGGEYATPIINYPEAGILAVGEIKRKPRVITDEEGTESIEPRSIMTLSLSFDHRLVDGAEGAQFVNEVMRYLENPELLLLE